MLVHRPREISQNDDDDDELYVHIIQANYDNAHVAPTTHPYI